MLNIDEVYMRKHAVTIATLMYINYMIYSM